MIESKFNDELYAEYLEKKINDYYKNSECFMRIFITANKDCVNMIDHFSNAPFMCIEINGTRGDICELSIRFYNMPFINNGSSYGTYNTTIRGYNYYTLTEMIDRLLEGYKKQFREYAIEYIDNVPELLQNYCYYRVTATDL